MLLGDGRGPGSRSVEDISVDQLSPVEIRNNERKAIPAFIKVACGSRRRDGVTRLQRSNLPGTGEGTKSDLQR